jgi:NAD(P)-dependent dehydrogenase (short-subunit alcohol dehydrogenase family)
MKSVFITGGARGIGLATADLFSRKGWRVGIGDLAGPQALPSNASFHHLDVRDRAEWQSALAEFSGADGLDVLVNNAGVVRYGHFEKIPPEDADLIIDTNVKGVINGAYAALPHLRRRPGACLVNIASAGAIYGGPDLAVYTASKFAVRGLSEALDAEFAPYGVNVRCVMPWFTETAMVHLPGNGRNASISDELGSLGIHGTELPAATIYQAVHGKRLHVAVGGKARVFQIFAGSFPGVMRALSRKQVIKQRGA